MQQMEVKPILSYNFDVSLYEDEIQMKGYCNDVIITLSDYSKYKVCFYDPVRLAQDLEEENYIAEPGLIIIKEVSIKNMENAVHELWLGGYFDDLKAI
jgi:hypothetical protein